MLLLANEARHEAKMSTTNKVPTTDEIYASFPNIPEPIEGEPDATTMRLLRRALKANAASVHSDRGGGQHGHLSQTVSPTAYLVVSNNVVFDIPGDPGNRAIIPINNFTEKQERAAIRQHAEDRREFLLYNNTRKALLRVIIESIETEFIADLEDENVGFEDHTVMEILTYLGDEYATIEPHELEENRNKLSDPFDMDKPFPVYIKSLQDIQNYAEEGGQPITNDSMVTAFYNRMKETGMVDYDVRTWEDKTPANKTFTNIKAHFKIAWRRYRNDQKTTKMAGCHSANAAMVEETADAIAAFASKAVQDSEAAEERNNKLLKEIAAMQATISKMQAGGHGGGGKQKPPGDRGPAVKATTCPYIPKKDNGNYCWTHGFIVGNSHTGPSCTHTAPGHKTEATRANTMGGSLAGKTEIEALK